jgi:hypothetical protein
MCIPLRLILVAQVVLGAPAFLLAQPQSGPRLLDFIRDAHQASRESIRTCSCRVEFVATISPRNSTSPKTQSCSGRFWYSPDAVRAKVSEFEKDVDYLWTDSVRQAVVRPQNGKDEVGASRGSFANRYIGRCDAWVRGLLVVNAPSRGIEYFPFEQFVSEATRLIRAERRSVDGKEMIVVQFYFEGTKELPMAWEVEVHFDPAVNYLVRKTIYTGGGTSENPIHRQDEVVQFKEYVPGLFFPERVVGWSETKGIRDFKYTTVLSEIQVNEPLPDGILRFRYPSGIYLTDSIRGTYYRIDSEGNRTSPETPLAGLPPPSVDAPAPSVPGTETQEEPRSATRWVLPVSLGILALGGTLALVRWRRRSTTAS